MDRNSIITQINNLFDENMNLKNELQNQKQYYENIIRRDEKNGDIYIMNAIEQKLYDIGLKHLFEEGFKPYYSMQPYDSDKYYNFEEWIDKSIVLDGFNDITKNEFIKLFSEKIKAEYERRLVKEKQKEKEEE